MMDESTVRIEVKVMYKGMYSTLWLDLSEYKNEDHYLELVKNHVDIAKQVIEKQTAALE